MGDKITIKELPDGQTESYTLVSPIESDPLEKKLSIKSPIGQSLLGHKKNDTVSIEIPSGKIHVKIISIQ